MSPPPSSPRSHSLSPSPSPRTTPTFALWRQRNQDSPTPLPPSSSYSSSSSSTPYPPAAATHEDDDELRMLERGAAEPWFIALLLVGFDADKGPVVEACVPDFALTHAEKEAVTAHAMPDSAAGGAGREDALFSFRLVRRAAARGHSPHRAAETPTDPAHDGHIHFGQGATLSADSADSLASSLCSATSSSSSTSASSSSLSSSSSSSSSSPSSSSPPPSSSSPRSSSSSLPHSHSTASASHTATSSHRLLLCHSLFRQAPDPSQARGSFQKALVLVTSTPYLTVPHMLLSALADDAFVFGGAALARAIVDAADWPDPRAALGAPAVARTVKLRLLRAELTVSLPHPFLASFAAPQAAAHLVRDDDDAAAAGGGGAGGLAVSAGAAAVGAYGFRGRTLGAGEGLGAAAVGRSSNGSGGKGGDLVDSSSPVSSADTAEAADDIPAPDLQRHRDAAAAGGGAVSGSTHSLTTAVMPSSLGMGVDGMAMKMGGTARWRRRAERELIMDRHPGASEPVCVRAWPLCMPSSSPTAPPFHEIDIMRALNGAHDRLWALWELVVLGEPLVVLAPTPTQCSSAVLAVISLIHPLPFVGDWRPYFCIQDADYTRFASAPSMAEALPRGGVFGVTSPHVLQTLKFPHILTVSGCGDRGVKVSYKAGLKTSYRTNLYHSRQLNGLMNAAISARNKRDQNAMAAAAFDVRSGLLERVTRPFLRAFDRYLEPTWGDGRSISEEPYASDPFGRGLSLINFSPDTFPETEDLSASGVLSLFKAGTVSRTRARSFYVRFVSGPVFAPWWRAARAAALRECAREHRQHMLEACARSVGVLTTRLADDAAQLDETVDLCLRLRSELAVAPSADSVLRGRLEGLLRDVGRALPVELMSSIGVSATAMAEQVAR